MQLGWWKENKLVCTRNWLRMRLCLCRPRIWIRTLFAGCRVVESQATQKSLLIEINIFHLIKWSWIVNVFILKSKSLRKIPSKNKHREVGQNRNYFLVVYTPTEWENNSYLTFENIKTFGVKMFIFPNRKSGTILSFLAT